MKLRTKIEGKEYESVEDTSLVGLYFIKSTIEFQEVKQPSYSRQEVLEEKWEPPTSRAGIFVVFKDNRISDSAIVHPHKWECRKELAESIQGLVFAPTRELAEEIVQIRLGKWLPKKGDIVYSEDVSFVYQSVSGDGRACYRDTTDLDLEHRIYFPSAAQRQTFIEKNKPKEHEAVYCKCRDAKYGRKFIDSLSDEQVIMLGVAEGIKAVKFSFDYVDDVRVFLTKLQK